MVAGRELDALIAEKIFGYPCEHAGFNGPLTGMMLRNGDAVDLPHFSTNIADAWRVVEILKAKGLRFVFGTVSERSSDGSNKEIQNYGGFFGKEGAVISHTTAATGPLAICLAALKAVDLG